MPKGSKKPPTAEEIAEMLGVAPEKTFKVDHESMGKAGKGIDMKVGGIGIQFIDKKGRDIPGESFLYVNVVGWKYSRGEQKLQIEVGKTGGPIEREVSIITAEGEEIGLLMRDHAKSVAKQLKQEKAEAKEKQEKMLAAAVGKYRIENTVTCREGPELDSEQTEGIEVGSIVDVTEAVLNAAGTTRLKCDVGWFSLKPHLVVKLDDEGNPIVDENAKKKIDTTGISADSVPVSAGTEAEELAKELGMLGDATFDVKQKYIKKTPQGDKCPEQVQLKVGGMGVNVFAGQKPVANYLYFAIKGWTYSQREETFDINLKSGEKIRFSTKQGAEIAENMNQHAVSLQTAKQEAAAAAEAEEGVPPEDGDYDMSVADDSEGDILLGYWRVQNPILVRAGVEVSTEEAGKLEPDDVVKVTEVSKNSTGTVRLKCKMGWVSFKPHLVRKLAADYKPDSSDLDKITETLERVLSMYSLLDDDRQLEVESDLVSKWVAVFGGGDAGAASPAADQRLVNAQKAAEESAEKAEALEKESAAKSEEIAALKEAASAAASAEGGQAAELSTQLDAANSTIVELKKELAAVTEKAEAAEAAAADASKDDSAEELATLRAAAEKAEDERATLMGKIEKLEAQQKKLQGDNATLKEQLSEAKKAGPPAAAAAADDSEPALPAEVQAIFDKANAADASKDKKTALTLYQTGVKKAMAHMKAHPETKKTLTPILQQVMKRAQELKAEIAAAKAPPAAEPGAPDSADSGDPEDPLPPDIRAEVNKAKAADTPGNEAAAIALFEASAKRAMVYLRANPAKKAELTPTLQALIMRTRALKEELKSAE